MHYGSELGHLPLVGASQLHWVKLDNLLLLLALAQGTLAYPADADVHSTLDAQLLLLLALDALMLATLAYPADMHLVLFQQPVYPILVTLVCADDMSFGVPLSLDAHIRRAIVSVEPDIHSYCLSWTSYHQLQLLHLQQKLVRLLSKLYPL